jgi:hypothetical protein
VPRSSDSRYSPIRPSLFFALFPAVSIPSDPNQSVNRLRMTSHLINQSQRPLLVSPIPDARAPVPLLSCAARTSQTEQRTTERTSRAKGARERVATAERPGRLTRRRESEARFAWWWWPGAGGVRRAVVLTPRRPRRHGQSRTAMTRWRASRGTVMWRGQKPD